MGNSFRIGPTQVPSTQNQPDDASREDDPLQALGTLFDSVGGDPSDIGGYYNSIANSVSDSYDAGDIGDGSSVDDNSDAENSDDTGDDTQASTTDPVNFSTSPVLGTGTSTNIQGFNRRPFSKNAESMFGTHFDPNNVSALANGGVNIHMQGGSGAEITAGQNATAYGSYTTTTQSQDVHGANQTGFFYGDGRKFEVDLFEPALHGGDVNTFTSGVWLDNQKVAEVSIKAADLGFNSFHDQPLTYKMDFSPGNIKISAMNANGQWQTVVDHSDPRITDQLARDTNFKQMFSVWGVNGQYNGAPTDFKVLGTAFSPTTI